MPGYEFDFNLTIGYYPPPPSASDIPPPKNLPITNVDCLVDGTVSVRFSRPLIAPKKPRESIYFSIIPDLDSDSENLNFNYTIEDISNSQIDLKLDFERPLEISQ